MPNGWLNIISKLSQSSQSSVNISNILSQSGTKLIVRNKYSISKIKINISTKVIWKCRKCAIIAGPICIHNINLFIRCSLAIETGNSSNRPFSNHLLIRLVHGSPHSERMRSTFRIIERSRQLNNIDIFWLFVYCAGAAIPVKCVTFHTHNLLKIMSNLIIISRTNVQYDVFPRKSVSFKNISVSRP